MTGSLDVDSYFARVRYSGPRRPTVDVLHALTAAHACAIPFENLDVLLDRPVRLEPSALFDKLVSARRGGYCFEQNGLLAYVLGQLGFRVTLLGARVRLGWPSGRVPPRTHMLLRVDVDGEAWLTDVGVGALSLTAAIRLETDAEQPTPHEPRRIVREDARILHQARLGSDWVDVCELTLDPLPEIDQEVANFYKSTSPRSLFKRRLMVARAGEGGRRTALDDGELTVRDGGQVVERRRLGSPRELLDVLAARFDLVFPAGTTFGPPEARWPRSL